ncbi:DUF7661 family protein [Aeromonas veronii]|uniref:DUF7661 family protein n=1 Tax=Aeromonas veronii TaxID=654 RepID=UPI003BA206DA
MMIFSVFGRLVGVKPEGEQWLLFNVSLPERKYSRIRDVIIPDFLTEDETPRWLDDIYHKAASAAHPDVVRGAYRVTRPLAALSATPWFKSAGLLLPPRPCCPAGTAP